MHDSDTARIKLYRMTCSASAFMKKYRMRRSATEYMRLVVMILEVCSSIIWSH